jgi:hypothetical protein
MYEKIKQKYKLLYIQYLLNFKIANKNGTCRRKKNYPFTTAEGH